VSQQFNDEVEQVAGNDIINKNNIYNFNLLAPTSEQQLDLVSRAVGTLITICNDADCKAEMYKISKTLFGTSYFKDLNLEQLTKLQIIAEALQSKAAKAEESHTAFTQEMNEYENFHSRIGIRASKPERAAITELMTTRPINPKQIKLAWSNSILFYEDNRLRVKLPVLEPWIGAALALLSGAELYVFIMQVVLAKPPIQQLVQQVPAFLLFTAALIGSTRYMIAPTFTGKRIKAAIERD
jgi:hypothetical protein